MTKTLAASYRQTLLDSSAPNLSSVNLKIVALDATYVYSAAHNFLDDIGGGSIVATTGNLASKTITDGVFDFANVSLGSPAGGDTITQLWLYYDTGSAATSPLIAYTNEDGAAAPISIATDGGDITLVVDASGFFRA
jgi:hypothetical protein